MRLVTYGGACSLDGYIARADGSVDWLHFSPDVAAIMKDYWARIDTMLVGRKTWEVMAASFGGGRARPSKRKNATKAGRIQTYVFSRTLSDDPAPGVTLVRDDPGAFVTRLKSGPGKDICVMGGGELAGSLFAAGVIDEVGFNIQPVLLGGGIPAFVSAGRETPLELVECRQIDGGCVYVSYRTRTSR
ncbi:MAG TPA: dihydrofolate reductase family protein [Vicinamibacterales bacterium]|nr:dihydrofolate reductase family protein [Vicinamibacterales bacterium]